MKRPTLIAARPASATRRPASAVLGSDHPLAQAIDALESVVGQLRAVAAVLTGSMIALSEGRAWAPAVAISAAIVLFGLIVVAVGFEQRKSDRAVDLILEGHENVLIAAVQRQHRRLLSQRTRTGLAGSFEDMTKLASNRPRLQMRGARPLFSTRVIAAVVADLRAVIQLLGADDAPTRGVAAAERLITRADSPLYASRPSRCAKSCTVCASYWADELCQTVQTTHDAA